MPACRAWPPDRAHQPQDYAHQLRAERINFRESPQMNHNFNVTAAYPCGKRFIFADVFKRLAPMTDAFSAVIPAEWLKKIAEKYLPKKKKQIEATGGLDQLLVHADAVIA
jgi:hypothetical protein